MKKHFTLAASFALALSLQAQSSQRASGSVAPRAKASQMQLADKARLLAPVVKEYDLTQTRDTLLAQAMSKYVFSQKTDSLKITYDEYGRRRLVLREHGECTRYTYKTGINNCWTECIVETGFNSGNSFPEETEDTLFWKPSSKEIRELQLIDNVPCVITRTFYKFDRESNEWEQRSFTRYDYAHTFTYNGEQRRGHVVEQIDADGSKYLYRWHEAAREYLIEDYQTTSGTLYYTYEYEFGPDYHREKEYELRDGQKVLEGDYWRYYQEGCRIGCKEMYYTDGKLTGAEGYRFVIEENVPQAGSFTAHKYNYRFDKLTNEVLEVKSDKFVFTGLDWRNKDWSYLEDSDYDYALEPGERGTVTVYRTSPNYDQPVAWHKEQAELFPSNVWKLQVEDLINHTTTVVGFHSDAFAIEGGHAKSEMEEVTFDESGSYSYAILSRKDDFSHIITNSKNQEVLICFNPQHERDRVVLKSKEFVRHPGRKEAASQLKFYEVENTHTLKPLSQFGNYRYDDQGRLISEQYELIDQGRKEQKDYTFTDQTTEVRTYTWADNQKYLSAVDLYEILPDGTSRQETTYYAPNNENFTDKLRCDRTPSGQKLTYKYNHATQSFDLDRSEFIQQERQMTEDGTRVTLNYEVKNDQAVPVSKNEYKLTRMGIVNKSVSASYRWDADAQEWVGNSKTWRFDAEVKKAYKELKDEDFMYYDDEYTQVFDLYSQPESYLGYTWRDIECEHSIEGQWNHETKQWETPVDDPENALQVIHPDDHTYDFIVETRSLAANREGSKRIYRYHTNEAKQLLLKSFEQIDFNASQAETFHHTESSAYAYNDKGLLARKDFVRKTIVGLEIMESEPETTFYYYGLVTILPTLTGIEEQKATDAGIKVEGRRVVTSPDTRITLYSIDGKKVAEGTGSVSVPAAGIYVARTAAGSCKILAR